LCISFESCCKSRFNLMSCTSVMLRIYYHAYILIHFNSYKGLFLLMCFGVFSQIWWSLICIASLFYLTDIVCHFFSSCLPCYHSLCSKLPTCMSKYQQKVITVFVKWRQDLEYGVHIMYNNFFKAHIMWVHKYMFKCVFWKHASCSKYL
jgi:hypothetical protein